MCHGCYVRDMQRMVRIDLTDAEWRELRALAAIRGQTLIELVSGLLRAEIKEEQ